MAFVRTREAGSKLVVFYASLFLLNFALGAKLALMLPSNNNNNNSELELVGSNLNRQAL